MVDASTLQAAAHAASNACVAEQETFCKSEIQIHSVNIFLIF